MPGWLGAGGSLRRLRHQRGHRHRFDPGDENGRQRELAAASLATATGVASARGTTTVSGVLTPAKLTMTTRDVCPSSRGGGSVLLGAFEAPIADRVIAPGPAQRSQTCNQFRVVGHLHLLLVVRRLGRSA